MTKAEKIDMLARQYCYNEEDVQDFITEHEKLSDCKINLIFFKEFESPEDL